MKNNILILGKGFIGERIKETIGGQTSDRFISSFKDAEEEILRHNPKVVINCIGVTGKNNVDDCELVKDEALMANTFVPIILSEVALRNKIKLVHISSGCIYHFDYSKDKPIDENKIPDYFKLFYSRTKIYSERALEVLAKKYPVLIARLRIPLDDRPHPKNLLDKLIKYKRVIGLPNSVTYIPDFVKALKHLIRVNATGIYNIVNKGGLSYQQLMETYRRYKPDFNYEIINLKSLKLNRTNLILSTKKLEKTGFKVRKIDEVLEECVKGYLKY